MRAPLVRNLFLLALGASACSPPPADEGAAATSGGRLLDWIPGGGGDHGNTQFGEEDDTGASGHCVETETTALGLDDETPFGTVSALVARVEGERAARVAWDDGVNSDLTVGATVDTGSVVLVRRDWEGPGGDTGVSCEALVRFEAAVRLDTSDGRLAEHRSGPVTVTRVDRISWEERLGQLAGSVDLGAFLSEGASVTGVSLSNDWTDTGVEGQIWVQFSSTTMAGGSRVATW